MSTVRGDLMPASDYILISCASHYPWRTSAKLQGCKKVDSMVGTTVCRLLVLRPPLPYDLQTCVAAPVPPRTILPAAASRRLFKARTASWPRV